MSDEENYEREESEIPNIRKTYIVTDELTTPLPSDFVWSMNKRYIEIQNCKLYDFVNRRYPDNVTMHVNLLHEREYLDNNVGLTNHIATQYKRYEVKGNEEELKIWFTKERGPPSNISDVKILREAGKHPPEFHDYDYSDLPNIDDLSDLMKFLADFFTSDIIDAYKDSAKIKDVSDTLNTYYQMFMFQTNSYIDAVAPLFEDESFYTNDFLLDKVNDIYQLCEDFTDNDHFDSPIVGKFVYYFKNYFKQTLEFDYETYFTSMFFPDMVNVGVCLTGPIFWEETNYNTFLMDLSNGLLLDGDPNDYGEYGAYICKVYEIKQKYNLTFEFSEFLDFTKYWTLIEPFANSYITDGTVFLTLASKCNAIDEFQAGKINDILTSVGIEPTKYTMEYDEPISNYSKSYFFLEIANLLIGKEHKEPFWVNFSEETLPTGDIVVTQIAEDPLVEWQLKRQLTYSDANPFPSAHYVLNPATNIYVPQYRFLAEFMLIF